MAYPNDAVGRQPSRLLGRLAKEQRTGMTARVATLAFLFFAEFLYRSLSSLQNSEKWIS